jgi:hypothetical protein
VRNLNVKIFLEALTLLIREWYGYIRHTLVTPRNVGGWLGLSQWRREINDVTLREKYFPAVCYPTTKFETKKKKPPFVPNAVAAG